MYTSPPMNFWKRPWNSAAALDHGWCFSTITANHRYSGYFFRRWMKESLLDYLIWFKEIIRVTSKKNVQRILRKLNVGNLAWWHDGHDIFNIVMRSWAWILMSKFTFLWLHISSDFCLLPIEHKATKRGYPNKQTLTYKCKRSFWYFFLIWWF